VGEFVFFGLGAEAQFIYVVDDFPQVVAAVYLVLDLSEYLTDFIFNGVGATGLLFEPMQVGTACGLQSPADHRQSELCYGQVYRLKSWEQPNSPIGTVHQG
jgi:hypothetical protein